MNMNKKTRKGRFLTLAVLMLTVLLVLSGCARQTVKTDLKYNPSSVDANKNSWDAGQVDKIGAMLKSVYDDASFDVRDWLIAADRGYDMLPTNDPQNPVDPATDNKTEGDKSRSVEYAKKVLSIANEHAKDTDKIENLWIESMNEDDLDLLVNNLKETVDVTTKGGLWDKILCGIGACLGWITRYLGFGSYIVGICLFAVIVEILLLPFAIKQQKNSIRQAQLRPKEMAIRNKYKGRNDQPTQQKVAQEIQELYQRENFSPYSGCLQLLLQFPILIALYNIVIDPLHYVLGQGAGVSAAMRSYYTAARAAGGLGQTLSASSNSTIALLSGNGISEFSGIANFAYFKNGGAVWESLQGVEVPDFNILGINFGINPNFENNLILLLVPVLTFVVYFFSMKISRKFTYQATQQEGVNDRQVACSNTMMDVSMPLMSTFFAFIVPAIIGVYWIFRSILGTLKQFIISRVMPLPVFTEEDYKAAAREMAGKAPKKVEKSARAGTVRSLHHIDDEDYEDTRERALKREEAMAAKEKAEQAERAKKTPFGMTSLKKDRAEEASEQETKAEETDEKQD